MKWRNIINFVMLPVLLFSISCLGFITDGNSKLVGSARIRQVRVKGDTCPVSPRLQHTAEECHAPYSLQTEDTSVYGEHWNTSVFDNSSDLSSAWQYQSQSKLRGHPSWGKLAVYSGGGYVIHLGTDPKNASRYHLCSCKLAVHPPCDSVSFLYELDHCLHVLLAEFSSTFSTMCGLTPSREQCLLNLQSTTPTWTSSAS